MADLALTFGAVGLGSMISDLTRLEGKALSVGGVFKSVAQSLSGPAGLAAIGAAATAFAKESVAAFAEFETGLNSLSAITGATGDDLKFFADQAKAIGETTTIGATEAVKAFELIGSAKPELLKSKEALASVTKEAIKLAEASGMSLPDAAQSAVGALNQYGAAADQAARFVNVLAAGALEGASPIQASTQALEQFGSVANGFNVSIEESIALVQTLADKNKMGAEAGTALRNVLLKMQTVKALDRKALEDMARLGVNMDIVANSAIPVSERLQELKKIGGDATAMMHVFGTENINAANILLTNTARFDGLTKAITGTNAAAKQQATQTQGLAASWTKIQNQIQNVMIEIGAAIAPVLREITDGFKPAFETVKALLVTIYAPMIKVVESFGGLFKALGFASGEGNKFVGVVKTIARVLEFVTLPARLVYQVIGKIVEVVTWVVDKFQSAKGAIEGFAEKIPGASTALKILEGVVKAVLFPVLALKDAWDYLFGDKYEATTQTDAEKAVSGLRQELARGAAQMGATNEQLREFAKTQNAAMYAGLSVADATKKAKEALAHYLAVTTDCKEATKAAIPPTADLAGTMGDLGAKAGPAAGSIDLLNKKLQDLKSSFSAAGTDIARIGIGNQIEKVEFQLLKFSSTVDLLKSKTAGIGGVMDAAALPKSEMDMQNPFSDAAFAKMEEGLPRVTQFAVSMKSVFADLAESVKGYMVSMASDVAYNIGVAIGSGGSVADVFKKALRELAVMVPKMTGIALLNAATFPANSPIALPLAATGLLLLGASGLIAGIFKAKDAKLAASLAPNVGGSQAPSVDRRGLQSFGETQSSTPYVIYIDGPNGQKLTGYMAKEIDKRASKRG